jgi:hypothetical protein
MREALEPFGLDCTSAVVTVCEKPNEDASLSCQAAQPGDGRPFILGISVPEDIRQTETKGCSASAKRIALSISF